MKTLFRILGTAAAVAVTGAAIVALDKILNQKDPLHVEEVEFPEDAEQDAEEAEKTAEATKETAKKTAEATKATAKKTAAKVAAKTAAVKAAIIVQDQNNEVDTDKVEEKVKAQFVSEGHKASSIKKLNMYIKPEESSAYYVINDKFSGRVDLF